MTTIVIVLLLFQMIRMHCLTKMIMSKNLGTILLIIGASSNLMVMALNGGNMPISVNAMHIAGITKLPNQSYAAITVHTRIAFLGDVIPEYNFFGILGGVSSIGDLVILLGLLLLWLRCRKIATKSNSNTVLTNC